MATEAERLRPAQPLFSQRPPKPGARHRSKRAGFQRTVGYVAQKRIFVRFKAVLVRMRLYQRARGDVHARIALTGFCTPGLWMSNGSLWVLCLSRAERREERALRTGIKRGNAQRKKRPANVFRFTQDTGVVRLLKARVRVNGRRRPRR
jgi:hypothetical protein